MATFKSFPKSKFVDSKYSGRKQIYLESDDDFAIFERWFFDEFEYLEFKSSNAGDGGGCTQVMGNVDKDRENGINSFGIVDRDALIQQQKWNDFWEDDDMHFLKLHPFGEHVKALCRWEIENYVMDLEAVYALLMDYGKYSPKGIDKNLLSNQLLRISKALVPVMAANLCLHEAGKSALKKKYCLHEDSFENIDKSCLNHLKKDGIDTNFEKFKTRLFSFEDGENSADQYWKLSRMIDGKRLLDRLKMEFGLKEDHRFRLATLIREKGVVAIEIKDLIQEIKNAA